MERYTKRIWLAVFLILFGVALVAMGIDMRKRDATRGFIILFGIVTTIGGLGVATRASDMKNSAINARGENDAAAGQPPYASAAPPLAESMLTTYSDGQTERYDFSSGRWFLYLIVAVIGSVVGTLLIGAIYFVIAAWSFGVGFIMFGLAPFLTGLALWVLLVPVYVLFCTAVGLSVCKSHAKSAFNAKVEPEDSPLYRRVAQIARRAGIRQPPEVGIYKSDDLNAFATGAGRDSSLVLFSSALLEKCSEREVDAVAAHEIGHIVNSDMLALVLMNSTQNGMTWVMVFYNLRMFIRRTIFFVTELAARHLSRKREFRADAVSAILVGAEPMIDALKRLDSSLPVPTGRENRYATAMFHHPWLNTHPPIAKRIEALQSGQYAKEFVRKPPVTFPDPFAEAQRIRNERGR